MLTKVSDSIKKHKVLTWSIIGSVLALCAVLITLGSFYDYQITDALYSKNWFAKLFTLVGNVPAMLIGVAFAACAFQYVDRSKRKVLTAFIIVLWIIESGIASYFFWDTAQKEVFTGMSSTLGYIFMGITPIFLIAGSFFLFRLAKTRETKTKLYYIFLILFFASFIANLVAIEGIRTFWGRPRYYTIDDIAVFFTPWYIPQGYVPGSTSFPSGHAASSTMALSGLLFLTQFNAKTWQKVLLIVLPVILIIGTCLSRMMLGMHFLSDVTFGFLFAASLLVASIFFTDRFCFAKIEKSLSSPADYKANAKIK